MTVALQQKLTPEEYLAREHYALEKSEYVNGEVRVMGGASLAHNLIVTNLASELHLRTKEKECRVLTSNMRVRTPEENYFYPDIVGFCGAAQLQQGVTDTLLNPVLLVEVLSPGTEAYDRGRKMRFYISLPTLMEYVLVAHDDVHVDQYFRKADGTWAMRMYHGADAVLSLDSLGVELPLSSLYAGVEPCLEARTGRL